MSIRGYKVFNSDWTCHGFQYEVGKTFEYEGYLELCKRGFHFCETAADCFNYRKFDSHNKVAEVEAVGNVLIGYDKMVTNKLKIVRELTWEEVLKLVNAGKDCTGHHNTGDKNSGSWNTGDNNFGGYNTGNSNFGMHNTGENNNGSYNTGDNNLGNFNSGSYNLGKGNTSNCNFGDWNVGVGNIGWKNVGNYNIGNRNTGNWNTCDCSTGFFNTQEQPIYAFNKPLSISYDEFLRCAGVRILGQKYLEYFRELYNIYMATLTQIAINKGYIYARREFNDKYISNFSLHEAMKKVWERLIDSEKQKVKEIPNFDAEVFKEITGIDVNE